ncbi:pyrroline-5-carboxylate reductase [Butyrivibrio sp.]|jgi:pyrroline-5-carboxylate reductase|uniref:pyrroline-5-carboxylate reductase n=1 Tax=Butyrivibrio sp. TaxID=28121 RepID=UPI001B415D9F|nr:pyrroline-5-carboxylate reductase [Butyrivibrio sp.]MBE5838469.1 pyrroline-5-carboxylate reductase [Butyrivibrio sp.]MBP3819140.1 pyrroline-5-carboxylate reductase [Butyrivibrio sp.]
MTIGFIGLGNMAKAMIGGILAKGLMGPNEIIGTAATETTRAKVANKYGIQTRSSNEAVAKDADIIILAVKPQYLKVVIADIMDSVDDSKIIVSIAAGKTINWLAKEFEKPVKIIRVMPNTPALVLEGCSAVCRNDLVTDNDFHFVIELLESFGKAYTVPESMMDVVVGISGSSPAYVFLFIEAMADAAVAGGMPRKQAYEFAAQSVLGSAKMVLETGKHPGELKDMVCSPAGTTIEAVHVLEKERFRGTVMDAVQACIEKSRSI